MNDYDETKDYEMGKMDFWHELNDERLAEGLEAIPFDEFEYGLDPDYMDEMYYD